MVLEQIGNGDVTPQHDHMANRQSWKGNASNQPLRSSIVKKETMSFYNYYNES
jgi:hypothetical protein